MLVPNREASRGYTAARCFTGRPVAEGAGDRGKSLDFRTPRLCFVRVWQRWANRLPNPRFLGATAAYSQASARRNEEVPMSLVARIRLLECRAEAGATAVCDDHLFPPERDFYDPHGRDRSWPCLRCGWIGSPAMRSSRQRQPLSERSQTRST